MSYKCAVCGKKPEAGNKRSHSNIKTRTKWMPNLQNVKLLLQGTVKYAWVCTRCLRSGKAQKAPIRKHVLAAKKEA